jgi:uncharacterized protein YcbK (DUF882 family)
MEPDPEPEPDTGSDWLAELDAELDAAGVRDFSARELTYLPKAKPPRHDEPPRELWPNLVAVAVLAQRVRDLYGGPLSVSSAWRPDWYNEAVGGASRSQHRNAAAVDLNVLASQRDDQTTRELEQAGARVWLANDGAHGFGVYRGARIHLDSSGGRRTWGEAQRVLDELEEVGIA